jgi:uncharacterized alpha-E superfamily protein
MTKNAGMKRRLQQRKGYLTEQISRRKMLSGGSGMSEMEDRIIAEHQDVLQNIEFALVTRYREDPRIDDLILAEALTGAILDTQPISELVQSVMEALGAIRAFREGLADQAWKECLQTVLRSVRRHSHCHRGQRDYIDFISPFLP